MTYESQRIALAEWENDPTYLDGYRDEEGVWHNTEPGYDTLDEMHRLEEKAPDVYWEQLAVLVGYGVHSVDWRNYRLLGHATVTQRREALLKTLGLWKD